MPKKEKKASKSKEEFLKELAETLKSAKRKEEIEKNEETKEDLEEIEFSNRNFSQFVPELIDAESGSPVLERKIITREPNTQLSGAETNFSQQSSTGEREEPDFTAINEPDYGTSERIEQPKYESGSEPPILKSRDFSRETTRVEFLNPLRDRGIIRSDSEPEKFEPGFFQEERRLPFEQNEKKYKEFKPTRRR